MCLAARQQAKLDVTIPLPGCRLWSPKHPFLYEVKIDLGSDAAKTRFGMRSFSFDPASKRAMLNGKPYFLRGSNVTILRFFEDAARGDLPWRPDWVRRLHQKFRGMHWNALRYCIGFPPDFWYDIADEEGILIEDEFPIWTEPWGSRRAGRRLPGQAQGRENHPRIHRVDARAVEPSVRGDLGRAERKCHAGVGQGDPGGAPLGPFRSPLGERLRRAAEPDRLRRVSSLPVPGGLLRKEDLSPERFGEDIGHAQVPRRRAAEVSHGEDHQRIRLVVAQSRRQSHVDRLQSL